MVLNLLILIVVSLYQATFDCVKVSVKHLFLTKRLIVFVFNKLANKKIENLKDIADITHGQNRVWYISAGIELKFWLLL